MLHKVRAVEFPSELKIVYKKALRYELISFLYMISASLFSFLTMFNSQTMKTVWLEDLLGIIPPLSFLISSRIIRWKPNKNFPYGFHKATGVAFLTSSLALFTLGVFLFVDGSRALLSQEHPTLPTLHIFGYSIWGGYVMILALLWSSLPSIVLGHLKLPLAHQLYDKILYVDSKMNKASWMSGFASIFGVIGIGLGFWWADATFAMIISLDICYDGYRNLKTSVLDLINEIPKTLEKNKPEPLLSEVYSMIEKEDWIKEFKIRFRDEGHIFFGEVFIEPKENPIDTHKIMKLKEKIENYNWRLLDIVIMPMKF